MSAFSPLTDPEAERATGRKGMVMREDRERPPFLDFPRTLPRAPLPRRHEARRDVGGDHGSGAAARGAFTAPGDDAALALLSADLLDRPTWKPYSVHMTDVRFEWDGPQSRTNKRKHGVSFEEAPRAGAPSA